MLNEKSRYKDTLNFTGSSETSTSESKSGAFKGLRFREIKPATGVIEYEVKQGDRLDHLAQNFYNNDRMWWRILDANPHVSYGADLMLDIDMLGSVILIPRESE
ncbi:MAG: hypothetical protein D6B28_09675 [Gammaproteobacteria bacterium]|nr:MAG: hypothetical protein D6B28_09675 [Gammaproteobacteria bacterium]